MLLLQLDKGHKVIAQRADVRASALLDRPLLCHALLMIQKADKAVSRKNSGAALARERSMSASTDPVYRITRDQYCPIHNDSFLQ